MQVRSYIYKSQKTGNRMSPYHDILVRHVDWSLRSSEAILGCVSFGPDLVVEHVISKGELSREIGTTGATHSWRGIADKERPLLGVSYSIESFQ